jgi:hypothetical protein
VGAGSHGPQDGRKGYHVRNRRIGYRDIGNSVDAEFMHYDIAMSETPTKDRARVTRDASHMRRGLAHKMPYREFKGT